MRTIYLNTGMIVALMIAGFSLSISSLRGQNYSYTPFVEEDTRWSYAFIRHADIVDYFNYQLKGDTMINGWNYKKLFSGCSENYIAALREETKRVFIKPESEDERLLYDFNLHEGDSMRNNGLSYWVSLIDTVEIGNTQRKRFVFNSGDATWDTWIEGIGSLKDFYPLRAVLLGYENQGINYQKIGTELVYRTDERYFNENDCNHDAMRSPIASRNCTIQIRNTEITVRFSSAEPVRISLLDANGQLLYNSSFLTTKEITIPPVSFRKWIYLLRLIYKNKNEVKCYKIIL